MSKEKDAGKRAEECLEMRKLMCHTELLHTDNNGDVIKKAMNEFVRDGTSCTIRMWTDPRKSARAVLLLTNNASRKSGVTIER